ncbi:hypothetical protein PALU110988_13465 [Paenibacillus lupini]|nr:hypothetical protein [Paenibacillus lupini]
MYFIRTTAVVLFYSQSYGLSQEKALLRAFCYTVYIGKMIYSKLQKPYGATDWRNGLLSRNWFIVTILEGVSY